MSDAVTWAKAQTCWLRPGVKDRSAGQTLVHLASYADAEGVAWALVGLLALEMDTSERTVQRGLAALKKAGLIEPTGEFKKHNGRLVPYYRLSLDQGPANTRERMRMEREARAAQAPGDMGVAPKPSAGRRPRHPTGDTGVAARGDTGVAQIGKEDSQGLTPSARACEAAQRAWATKAPERVSPTRVARAWSAAIDRTSGLDPDRLLAAVKAAVRADPDFARNKAMNLDRWLDESRFTPWLVEGDEPGLPARPSWSGPDDVRAAVVGAMGEAAAVAYVDPAGWDDRGRVILARTTVAKDRLWRDARAALARKGVTVEVRRGA
jgi:DNA-binding transcriptional ArsR family regulator